MEIVIYIIHGHFPQAQVIIIKEAVTDYRDLVSLYNQYK